MKTNQRKPVATDYILLAVSALFLLGMLFVFSPCGPKEDGSWMTCHWAGNVLTGLAGVLTVIALVHLFAPDAKMKMGLDLAAAPVAVLAVCVPGGLVNLCMMDTMRCHAVTAPAAVVFAVLTLAAAAADFIVQRKKEQ